MGQPKGRAVDDERARKKSNQKVRKCKAADGGGACARETQQSKQHRRGAMFGQSQGKATPKARQGKANALLVFIHVAVLTATAAGDADDTPAAAAAAAEEECEGEANEEDETAGSFLTPAAGSVAFLPSPAPASFPSFSSRSL